METLKIKTPTNKIRYIDLYDTKEETNGEKCLCILRNGKVRYATLHSIGIKGYTDNGLRIIIDRKLYKGFNKDKEV